MAEKYLKWSDKEKTLLLNFVIDNILKGVKIKESFVQFSELYPVPVSCVSAQWQYIAEENKALVDSAKNTWVNVVKPMQEYEAKLLKQEQRAALKAEKLAKIEEAKRQRMRIRMQKRHQMLKLQAEKRKAQQPVFVPSVPTMRFQVDASGMVLAVNKL